MEPPFFTWRDRKARTAGWSAFSSGMLASRHIFTKSWITLTFSVCAVLLHWRDAVRGLCFFLTFCSSNSAFLLVWVFDLRWSLMADLRTWFRTTLQEVQKSFPPSSCSSPPNSVTRSRGVTYKAVLDRFRAGGAVTTNLSILTLNKVRISFQFFSSWYLVVKGPQRKTRDAWNPGTFRLFKPETLSNQFFNKWWWGNSFWACTLFSLRCWEVMPLLVARPRPQGSGDGGKGGARDVLAV